MTDLVDRLRRWTVSAAAVPVGDLMDEAADEITRLRGDVEIARMRLEASYGEAEKLQHRVRLQDSVIRSGDVATLTEAERGAVERARRLIASMMPYESQQGAEDYQALRGLLERMSPTTT